MNPIGPNNCPIVERTGDGRLVGRCWFYIGEKNLCPRHGDVSEPAMHYRLTGMLTSEPLRDALAKKGQKEDE